jgi:hypothetical protein
MRYTHWCKQVLVAFSCLLLAASCTRHSGSLNYQNLVGDILVSAVHRDLPADVLPDQITSTYSIGDHYYALAVELNVNYNVPALRGRIVSWHGVLQRHGRQSWEKFFTIVDPQSAGKVTSYNPVGVFYEHETLYVDIVNSLGAGSGEGQLTRLASTDNDRGWRRVGCYYFVPERYYFAAADGSAVQIRPHNLVRQTGCAY